MTARSDYEKAYRETNRAVRAFSRGSSFGAGDVERIMEAFLAERSATKALVAETRKDADGEIRALGGSFDKMRERALKAEALVEAARDLAVKWRDDAGNDILYSEGHHIACFQHARELNKVLGVERD